MPTPPDSPGKAPGLDLMRLLVIAACTTYLGTNALALLEYLQAKSQDATPPPPAVVADAPRRLTLEEMMAKAKAEAASADDAAE